MKKKLSTKLSIKKETLGSLTSTEMRSLKGGVSNYCNQSVPAIISCPCSGITTNETGFATCYRCK